ncbi:PLDc N-terminal domain-containing protein [Streptomyces sp. NPDC048639]|uniref:PLDc N-terminal domain-containing protein n=1 Tax=Streptomyces sp. NPDC048639 TaxID=3365581 RepID=UPI0037172323
MLRYLPFLLVLGLWIYAFIDCLNTPEDQVRKLPKPAWVLIIVLFGYLLFGSLAWLLAGRARRSEAARGTRPYGAGRGRARWVAPDDNPEFLKSLGQDGDKGKEKGQEKDKQGEPDRDGIQDRDGDRDGDRDRDRDGDRDHGPDDKRP